MSDVSKGMDEPLLRVRGLSVAIATAHGTVHAVDGVDLDLHKGRTLALVGESGSGKTMLSRAIMGLLSGDWVSVGGEISLAGQNIGRLPVRQRRKLRGPEMAMVFQDAMTSLNPVMKIGTQLTEGMRHHLRLSRRESQRRAVDLLKSVGISSPERRLGQYPFELSGGMRQRVTIAIALACNPILLIADEPTTALDVTIQAQILRLLDAAKREREMAMILVTHDLNVAAAHTDEIAVMYAGKIVERAPAAELFRNTRMPYTQALLDSVPNIDEPTHTPLRVIAGQSPDLTVRARGCSFAARCSHVQPRCLAETPVLRTDESIGPDHAFACWYPLRGESPMREAAVPEPSSEQVVLG